MKKSLVAMVLVVVFCLVIGSDASAKELRSNSIAPNLIFDGTTAYCEVTIVGIGNQITAMLELWQGEVFIDSWTRIDTSKLVISETCEVEYGKTYTLKVSGMIGSERFTGISVTGTCK